jgi:hypothetical protein
MVSDKNDTNIPSLILEQKSFFIFNPDKNSNILNKSQHFINTFFDSQHSTTIHMA